MNKNNDNYKNIVNKCIFVCIIGKNWFFNKLV